jgi:malto-oligosyltrehalose trehalohydrolase
MLTSLNHNSDPMYPLDSPVLHRNPDVHLHDLLFGANLQADGRVEFNFCAPVEPSVSLVIEGEADPLPMSRHADGWFRITTDLARAGSRYRFRLDDGQEVPDPASRFQPDDIKGPSEVIDPNGFTWSDQDWRGRPWEECVIYELHVGSFTAEGTYRAVIEKLDHLVELGVTAIELMPLADFPGTRNWGYDGVLLFAPDSSYGRPDDLRTLVDVAHAKGLMVFLDVVYNHFGPEGNFIPNYAPQLFTDKHKTPWGNAVNYGDAGSKAVRAFIIANACYWVREFHFDGLRLDAVHAIIDESEPHILKELAETVRTMVGDEKYIHLVIENDLNQAHLLERDERGQPRWYNAQWNDDFHHCLHAAATKEIFGYYRAYEDSISLAARALAEGFAYQGEVSPFTNRPRGEISNYLPPTAFVSFIQNHDQIGNRPFGERITDISSWKAARAITAIYLLAPEIPLLFMGEEWHSDVPFQYFCNFEGELADNIRDGRREEFAGFPAFSDPAEKEKIPDPTALETFEASKLDWDSLAEAEHAEWLGWYKHLLAVRREHIIPNLKNAPGGIGERSVDAENCIHVCWQLQDGVRLHLLANLADRPTSGHAQPGGEQIWLEGTIDPNSGGLAPWTVAWFIDRSANCG